MDEGFAVHLEYGGVEFVFVSGRFTTVQEVWQLLIVIAIAIILLGIWMLVDISKFVIEVELFTIDHMNEFKRIIVALLEVLRFVAVKYAMILLTQYKFRGVLHRYETSLFNILLYECIDILVQLF